MFRHHSMTTRSGPMGRWLSIVGGVVLVGACGSTTATPTPTPVPPTSSPAATATSVPTPTVVPSATASSEPTATQTPVASPTATATVQPTPSATASSTIEPTPSSTASPSPSPTAPPAAGGTIVAGGGTSTDAGDLTATEALLDRPLGVAAGPDGTIWVVEANTGRVRWVDDGGILHTAADALQQPRGIALGTALEPFVAETSAYRIITVLESGRVTTVAGTFLHAGFAGDRGRAKRALLSLPADVAVDDVNDLYIADTANNRIRMVNAATGRIDTIVGDGTEGYSGDGGQAADAQIDRPEALEVDRAGTRLYIADTRNNRIRMVDLTTGIISTIGGNGGFSGPIVPTATALETPLNHLNTLALDGAGNLYMVVNYTGFGNVIMQMSPTGTMTRVIGGGASPDPSVAPLDFALPNVSALAIETSGALLMASNEGLVYRFPGIGAAFAP